MRNSTFLTSMLMMLLALGGVTNAELVTNGDMELGGSATTLPDAWTHYGEGLYATSTTETPSGMGQSLYLFDNSGGVYNDIAYQYVPTGIEAGENYSFSMTYKGDAGVRVMLYYPGNGIAYANNFDPTSEWTDVSFPFSIIPQFTAGDIEIHLYTINPYTPLFIDDVSLVKNLPVIVLLEGDANRDGVVSAGDYASVQSNFGNTGENGISGDANGDGVVSAGDYASVQANFGNVAAAVVTPVPEPATMTLLGLGMVAIVRRRLK